MAVKKTKKSENTALQQLKAALKSGTPGRLYAFYGDEVYLRDRYLARLKAQLLPEGLEDFNLHLLSGRECTPLTLSEAIDNLPMMSERSLVLVQDFDLFKSRQEAQTAYLELLSELPDYVCVLFLYDTIKLDGNSTRGKLGKLFKEQDALVQFTQQEATDLIPWISARFKSLDRDISRAQAEYLIFVTGGMMSTLDAEISKVAAFSRERSIRREDIDAVCEPVLDAVTFQLTDHLAQGEFEKALAVLSDLFATQQPPMMILAVLSKLLRQLYTARLAYEQNRSIDWLVELWEMKSSWQAERLLRNARRFPAAWYRRALLLCAEADRRLKLSYREEEPILTELLLRLSEEAGA